jgi:hypothetical protein
MPIKAMTEEHKAKLSAARNAYWAKRKAAPEVHENIAKSIFAPAKDPKLVNQGGTPKFGKDTMSSSREKAVYKVNRKLDKILDAQIDAATGLYYVTDDGKHVYTKKPDTGVGEYLLNQVIGKPKENIEVKSVNLNVDI